MKKNIKVGLYFQSLSRKGGGAEKNIIWLSNELQKNNYDVHLFSWDKKNSKSFYQISKKIKWHKMYDANLRMNKFQRFMIAFENIRKNNISILIGFVMSGDGTIFLASKLNLIKIICAERNEPSMYDILYSPFRKKINFLQMHLSNAIVVQQNIFKNLYPSNLQKKVIRIPNPVFDKKINPILNNNRKKIILFVGRLEKRQKRPMLLLKEFNRIKNKIPDWSLYFVGDGEERIIMEEYILENSLISKVKIFDYSKNINDFYEMANIFVTTSLWEGFPNSLAEAMKNGLPCIGSAESIGVKSLLNNNCGWLVKSCKGYQLGNAILKCINNEEETSKKVIKAVNKVKKYDPKTIYKSWEKLIASFQ